MGGYARATYPGGGFQTEVGSGPGYGPAGGGGMPGMPPWFAQAMQERIAQQQEEMRLAMESARMQNEAARFSLDEMKKDARGRPMLGTWDSPQGMSNLSGRENLRQQRTQNRMLEGQESAMSRPAPTKMLFGPGIVPGRTLDPMAMSGFQRQAFLPQGSAFTGGPTPMEAGRYAREEARGTQAADLSGIQDMRRFMGGSMPGPGPGFGGYAGSMSPPARAQMASRREQPRGGGAGSLY